MKIFNKEGKTNPEEDTQTGAESFEARNSGCSAEEANEPGETSREAPVESRS